jgi:two-component system, NarL family, response regulator DevR
MTNADSHETRIRVYILDDHELVRRGLHDLLDREPGIAVVGEGGLVADALRDIAELEPDVALLDVRLPDGSGIEVCRQVRSDHPHVACLILTAVDDMPAQLAAITAGAAGYVLKEIGGPDLVRDIRAAAAGQSLLDPEVSRAVVEGLRGGGGDGPRSAPLTEPERQVLELIAAGLTNRQIGEKLFIPEKTVTLHVTRLLVKLGLLGGHGVAHR